MPQGTTEEPARKPMHPILARWGELTLYMHDAFSVVALVVGFATYYAELLRRGWLDSTIVWISLAALLGSKCFLRRPTLIIGVWAAIGVADMIWIFVLGGRLPA